MRSNAPAYDLRTPKSLSEVLELLATGPDSWRPMAGGTDLMVLFEAGLLPYRRLLSIWTVPELRGITTEDRTITLGALTTYTEVLRHPVLRTEFPLLAAAARETGGIATQNRGTLGGNIVNASPAADSPPALLVYEAEVELASVGGSRWLPYRDFHTGYKQTRLYPHELLTRIRLPRDTSRFQSVYRKVGTRKAQAISKVCFAGLRDPTSGEVRIAFGSVAQIPLRCVRTEAAIRERRDPIETLALEIKPIDDMRSNAAYRLRVSQNLLREFLNGR